ELKDSFRSLDDGRSFWEHAAEAGYEPARWRECIHILDDLTGWVEMHIEQARVLQDTGNRIGIVTAIAGYVHADVFFHGRADLAAAAAERRGLTAEYRRRQTLPATPLDERIVAALEEAAKETGEPYMPMASGAAHDTMCVADQIPCAMVFVPCKDGISHSPHEDADPADAALAAEIILNAIRSLQPAAHVRAGRPPA